MDSAGPDKEFMATLAKGLAVIQAFGAERPKLTLSDAAEAVGLSRAAARRVLRTLTLLGFVEQDGRHFALGPRILDLGFSYLASQSWIDHAHRHLKSLSEQLHEVVLGVGASGRRDHLRGPRANAAHHVKHGCGRHAAARLSYLDGSNSARLSAGWRALAPA